MDKTYEVVILCKRTIWIRVPESLIEPGEDPLVVAEELAFLHSEDNYYEHILSNKTEYELESSMEIID